MDLRKLCFEAGDVRWFSPVPHSGLGGLMLTGHQIRDARRLIGWTVLALARVSKVSRTSLSKAEFLHAEVTLREADALAVRRAFEAVGIEFIDDDPPSVRLKETT